MITIYWHCLGMTEDDERFVAAALKELAQHLKVDPKDDPIKLSVSIKPLGDEQDLTKKVDAILNRLNEESYTFTDCAAEVQYVLNILPEGNALRLLVYCHPNSYLAKTALRGKDSAKWGATCGSFSAAYPPKDQLKRKFTIWHETVHLLLRRGDDLDECYEPYPPYHKKADCNCDTCIMQFEPPKKWGGEWSLCDKIIGFLRDISKNCRESK